MDRSSTEAKYRLVTDCVTELTWLQKLLCEVRVSLSRIPNLYCDNIFVTCLDMNHVFNARMKHIEFDVHFIRECVTSRHLHIRYLHIRYLYSSIHCIHVYIIYGCIYSLYWLSCISINTHAWLILSQALQNHNILTATLNIYTWLRSLCWNHSVR